MTYHAVFNLPNAATVPCCDEDFVLLVFCFLNSLYYIQLLAHSIFIAPQTPISLLCNARQLSSPPPVSFLFPLGRVHFLRIEVLSQRRATTWNSGRNFRDFGDSLFDIFFRANRPRLVIRALTEKGLGTRGGSDKRRSQTESFASTYHICVPFSTVVESQSLFADLLSSLPDPTPYH